jgi:hypothetical protein
MKTFRLEKLLYLNSKKSLILVKFVCLLLKKNFKVFEKDLLRFFIFKKMKLEALVLLLLYSEISLNPVIFRKLIKTTEFFFLKTPTYRRNVPKFFRNGKSNYRLNRLTIKFFFTQITFSSFLNSENFKKKKKKFILEKYNIKCNFLKFFPNIWYKTQFFFHFFIFSKNIFFYLKKLKKIIANHEKLEFQKNQNLDFKNFNLQKSFLTYSTQKKIKVLKPINLECWLFFMKRNNFGKNKNCIKKSFKIKNRLVLNSILVFSPIITCNCHDFNKVFDIFFEEIYKPIYLHDITFSLLSNLLLIRFKKKKVSFLVKSIFSKKRGIKILISKNFFYKSFIMFSYIFFLKILKIRILSYYLSFWII